MSESIEPGYYWVIYRGYKTPRPVIVCVLDDGFGSYIHLGNDQEFCQDDEPLEVICKIEPPSIRGR